MQAPTKVSLRSSEGRSIDVEKEIAIKSVLIKTMMADLADALDHIPLPNVSFHILEKVLEWCKHHKDDSVQGEENANRALTPWEEEFCKIDQNTLFELILAANYLDVKPLLDIGCKTVANMIKGKTAEELQTILQTSSGHGRDV